MTLALALPSSLFAADGPAAPAPDKPAPDYQAALATDPERQLPIQNPESKIQNSTGSLRGRVSNGIDRRFLTNARITVEGTTLQTFTNEFGDYRLANVPAGEVTITAFFTGLATESIKVTLVADQQLEQDFVLGPQRARQEQQPQGAEGQGQGPVIKLDTFSVVAHRDTSISTIATNEQRFASNIKTVIDTNAFGDITTGNVGDFLKFMPGVSVNYDGPDPQSAMVRGFGASYTAVTTDGMPVANAAGGDETRTFQFDQMSLNNVSRVEVTKVPLPSMRADSLGGNVNMVTKNAFESKTAKFEYRAGGNFNSNDYDFFNRTPSPGQNPSLKLRPNFDFSLTLPVSRNFGIVITAQHSDQFTEQQRSENNWYFENDPKHDFKNDIGDKNFPDPATAYYYFNSPNSPGYKPGYAVNPPPVLSAQPVENSGDPNLLYNPLYNTYPITNGSAYTDYLQSNPYMRQYIAYDQPRFRSKDSFGLRADWRITRNSTLSLQWQIGYSVTNQQKNNMKWDISQTAAYKVPLAIFTDPSMQSPLNLINTAHSDPTFGNIPGSIYNVSDYFRSWGYSPQYGGYYSASVAGQPGNSGQANITQTAANEDRYGITNALNLVYRYNGPEWTFDMTLNGSIAKSWQRDMANGHFGQVGTAISGKVDRLVIGGIQSNEAPTMIQGYDTSGNPMDITNLNTFYVKKVLTNPIDSKDTWKTIQTNLQRNLNALPFFATIKFGGEIRRQQRDTVANQMQWDVNSDAAASDFMDVPYSSRPQAWGLPNLQFPSTYLVYQDYLRDIQDGPSPSMASNTSGYYSSGPGGVIMGPAIPGPNAATIPFLNGYAYAFAGARPDLGTNPTKPNPITFPLPVAAAGDSTPNANYESYEEYKFSHNYYIQETITSFYMQLDAKFFDNRLSITTGFRYEGTRDVGLSAKMPAYKIPDPSNPSVYLTDAQLSGSPPYENINGNLQDLYNLLKANYIAENWIIRGQRSAKSYADIYPSFLANYNVTANTIARFSYAKTLGRPDFSNIIPIARFNNMSDPFMGDTYTRITTSNPALKPFTANNFDLSLEYYFKNGGVASISGFYKSVANAFGNVTIAGTPELLAEMGIDNTFVNPQLIMPVNVGTLTAKGIEANLRAPLTFIPNIGRYLAVTANATVMDIKAPYNAQLDGFVKQSANWGINIITSRLILMLNWNWRGEQKLTAMTGVQYQPQDPNTNAPLPQDFQGYYMYIEPRITLDANLEYIVTRHFNFFVNARNLTNAPMVWDIYNNKTPSYARTYATEKYGTQISFGIKGTF